MYCAEWEFEGAEAKRGFAFARQIAEVARYRRERFADYPDIPQSVSVDDVAGDECLSPAYVRRLITIARKQRFGTKSDRAIRREVRPKSHPTACADCRAELPTRPRGSGGRPRLYCDECSTPAARKRRSRAPVAIPEKVPTAPATVAPETIRCGLCGEEGTVTGRRDGRAWWRKHRETCTARKAA